MDPQRRMLIRVDVEDASRADLWFSRLMGDQVEPRKDFIRAERERRALPGCVVRPPRVQLALSGELRNPRRRVLSRVRSLRLRTLPASLRRGFLALGEHDLHAR